MNTFIINNQHYPRNIRNELLNRSDKYILSDYPITLTQQMQVKLYRQELRYFINNNEINISWERLISLNHLIL